MKPVFVDRSGRRRRLVRVAGATVGLTLTLAAALMVAGFTGAGPGHLPLLPDPAGDRMGTATKAPRPAVVPAPSSPRPSRIPDAPTTRPTRSSGVAATATVTATPATTATPAPSRSGHRRVPTHTPGNKPSKSS